MGAAKQACFIRKTNSYCGSSCKEVLPNRAGAILQQQFTSVLQAAWTGHICFVHGVSAVHTSLGAQTNQQLGPHLLCHWGRFEKAAGRE
jgi:hypothetical protein